MVRILLIGLISIMASHANALDKYTYCKDNSDYAEIIMRARQAGVPMSNMMDINNKNGESGEVIEDFIIEAFGEPRFEVEKNQQKSIEDFRDAKYLQCIKALYNRT